MFWGRQKQSAAGYSLILDIGTQVAKALLVTTEGDDLHIVGRAYIPQAPGSMTGGMIADLDAVTVTCHAAIQEVFNQSGQLVDTVILGVSGQMVESVTTTVHYDRSHPEHPLQALELKNIIYKIQQRSYEKLRAALNQKFTQERSDIELIHAAVTEVQLDGYPVANPISFQGKRLSLTIFNAYIPLVYASVLQNLAKNLGLTITSIAAQPYGLAKVFAKSTVADDFDDGIFIDLGGGTTDVVVLRGRNVEGMQSFAFGGADFTHALKRELKISYDKAEQLKLDYAAGEAPEKLQEQIAEVCAETARAWIDGVRLSLLEFSETKLLPSRIYLAGGAASLPEIKRILTTKAWTEGIPFAKKPSPRLIDPDLIDNVVDDVNLDWRVNDVPPLGLANLTLNLLPEDDVVGATLQSIVRAMQQS